MGEFIVFVSTIFVFGAATAFLIPYLRRHSQRLDQGVDHEVLARLLEDVDQLSNRLNQVEDELSFFKDLRAPDSPGRLSPPEGIAGEESGEG